MRRHSGARTERLTARARKQAGASSAPRAPGLSETDRAGSPFYTRARSLEQLAPGRSPTPGPSLEVVASWGQSCGSLCFSAGPQRPRRFQRSRRSRQTRLQPYVPRPRPGNSFLPELPRAAWKGWGAGGNDDQALGVSRTAQASSPQAACEDADLPHLTEEGGEGLVGAAGGGQGRAWQPETHHRRSVNTWPSSSLSPSRNILLPHDCCWLR